MSVGQTGLTGYDAARTAQTYRTADAAQSTAAAKTTGASKSYGNTIGNVELSDAAAKYYEELKSKYSDMDFVLVSNDSIDGAEQQAAQYANAGRTLVLIDADKVERMAEDEEYREKYESIIANAGAQLDSMADQLAAGLASNVKTYGIKVDDNGNTSYFAVVDKSLASQRERIAKNRETRAAEKKEANKKADKKAAEERLEKAREKNKTEVKKTGDEDLETVSASSVEDLIKRLNDSYYAGLSDMVRTEQELQVGTQFDLRL